MQIPFLETYQIIVEIHIVDFSPRMSLLHKLYKFGHCFRIREDPMHYDDRAVPRYQF